jgi:hypothetical protein
VLLDHEFPIDATYSKMFTLTNPIRFGPDTFFAAICPTADDVVGGAWVGIPGAYEPGGPNGAGIPGPNGGPIPGPYGIGIPGGPNGAGIPNKNIQSKD